MFYPIHAPRLNNSFGRMIYTRAFTQWAVQTYLKLGIKKEILSKIFNKNFTTKSTQEGTGIGLHMSKKIIETKVHGSLIARNHNNKAIFTITIPK